MKETVRISCLFSFALRVYARGGIIVLKEVVAMKEIANKRYIALNNHLILCVVLFVVFIFISFFSFVDREIFGGVFFSLLTLLPIMVFLLSPIYYVFSSKEIIIVYWEKRMYRMARCEKHHSLWQLVTKGRWLTNLFFCLSSKRKNALLYEWGNCQNNKNQEID